MAIGSVTFTGATLITPAQGEYDFNPGLMQPIWQHVRPARATGEIRKHMGTAGCDHSLQLYFLDVVPGSSAGQVLAIVAALQNMAAPTSGTPVTGSLVVPDYGTFPYCAITSVVLGPQTARVKLNASTPATASQTQVYDIDVTITFHQTRR